MKSSFQLSRAALTAMIVAASGIFALLSQPALAAQYTAGPITIVDPQAAPTVPGLSTGGVFFGSISSADNTGDRLIGASSPVAEVVEVHRMMMQDNIMRMRAVESVAITRDKPVSFERGKPDTYHLMMLNLKQPLEAGQTFPVTLVFEKAGEVEVTVEVFQGAGGHGAMKHGAMKHGDMKHGDMKHGSHAGHK